MKKHELIIIICLLFSALKVQADGPPVKKNGTITTEHLEIKITSEQLNLIEKSHIVELTEQQHELLKKYYKNIPNKFVLLTPHFNDCTCDLIYLVWNRKHTI